MPTIMARASPADIRVDFAAVMERMRRIRARISRADSARRLTAAGVDVFFGEARFTGTDALTVDGATAALQEGADRHRRAAGHALDSRPRRSRLSDQRERLRPDRAAAPPAGHRRRPARLRTGAGVLPFRRADRSSRRTSRCSCPRRSATPRRSCPTRSRATASRCGSTPQPSACACEGGQKIVDLVSDDYHSTVAVDAILTGTGRVPNVDGLNLEAAGVDYDSRHGIRVDDFLRTSNPRIYAAGDVCLEHKFTHTADASARIAVQQRAVRSAASG